MQLNVLQQNEITILYSIIDERETQSIYKDGKFSNPWSTWNDIKLGNFLKWSLFTKNNRNIPSDQNVISDLNLNQIRA